MKLKAAVIGANGYTGVELLRLLHFHPNVEIAAITSQSQEGKELIDIYPQFQDLIEQKFKNKQEIMNENFDVLFLALPHGAAMEFVKEYKGHARIIDLSADFRLKDEKVFLQWYNQEHLLPQKLTEVVYGLTEICKDELPEAVYVANPGCYPTASALSLLPLIHQKIIETSPIIIDAKSGVTGAGAKPSDKTHFTKVNDNFSAYALKTHRHTPEIEQTLKSVNGEDYIVQFSPHLLPVNRGILTTVYAKPKRKITPTELRELYREFYSEDHFVRIVDTPPSLKDVKATNFCNIYPTYDERTQMILIVSVIDNLVKGASGQAIQNMNLMFGYEETTGLIQIPVSI